VRENPGKVYQVNEKNGTEDERKGSCDKKRDEMSVAGSWSAIVMREMSGEGQMKEVEVCCGVKLLSGYMCV
jgi:3,4-dihydroxy-2-butanone 4-phosphate synthase